MIMDPVRLQLASVILDGKGKCAQLKHVLDFLSHAQIQIKELVIQIIIVNANLGGKGKHVLSKHVLDFLTHVQIRTMEHAIQKTIVNANLDGKGKIAKLRQLLMV